MNEKTQQELVMLIKRLSFSLRSPALKASCRTQQCAI